MNKFTSLLTVALIGLATTCLGQSDYDIPLGSSNAVGTGLTILDTNSPNGQTYCRGVTYLGSGTCLILETNMNASFVSTNPAGTVTYWIIGGTQAGGTGPFTGGTTNAYAYITNAYNVALYPTNISSYTVGANGTYVGGQYPTNTYLNTPNMFPLGSNGVYTSDHTTGLWLGGLLAQCTSGGTGIVWFTKGVKKGVYQ